MRARRDIVKASWEMTAFVVGFLATVPLLLGVTVAWLSNVTGMIPLAMIAAPIVLWACAFTYWRAFEGAKDILALSRAVAHAPRRADRHLADTLAQTRSIQLD